MKFHRKVTANCSIPDTKWLSHTRRAAPPLLHAHMFSFEATDHNNTHSAGNPHSCGLCIGFERAGQRICKHTHTRSCGTLERSLILTRQRTNTHTKYIRKGRLCYRYILKWKSGLDELDATTFARTHSTTNNNNTIAAVLSLCQCLLSTTLFSRSHTMLNLRLCVCVCALFFWLRLVVVCKTVECCARQMQQLVVVV